MEESATRPARRALRKGTGLVRQDPVHDLGQRRERSG